MAITLESITPGTIESISYVGRVVTHQGVQYRVHSVEGQTYYAFERADGTITADLNMTKSWSEVIWATVLPMGTKVGEGFSSTVRLSACRKGVSLVKDGDR